MFGFPSGWNSHWGDPSLLERLIHQLFGFDSCFPGLNRHFPQTLIMTTQVGWPRSRVGKNLTFATTVLFVLLYFVFVSLSGR